ncbi:hypothetical protein ACJJTC_010468 [Scirpophaga incertulas]
MNVLSNLIADFAKEKVFWTRKMNIKLVKFIQSRPSIWNPKHPKYTSVQVRDRIFAEFAAKYNNEFSGQAVKERWTNIRSTFANYLRKLNARRAKGDEDYKIYWDLWEPCQFLLQVNRKSQNYSMDNVVYVDEKEDIITEDIWDNEENMSASIVIDDPDNICRKLAENLATVFKGVQNDSFGLYNTENGKIGSAVAKKLSQMNSFEAAKISRQIMDILIYYNKENPDNPNKFKSGNKDNVL